MADQSNNRNYTRVGTAGQKRRAPPPPPIQATSGNRQMPAGRGGGPRQQPQHYQQQIAAVPESGPVSNIEQPDYVHHSQPYQASYGEGTQGAQGARSAWDDHDDHDRHNVQDVEAGPLSATLNDKNATVGNCFPPKVAQSIYATEQYLHDLVSLERAKTEATEKARSETRTIERIKL